MQELVLNGKTYVKAADIAKHLGYTSDYVGQLCRAGKVDAERVGRAWYVVPNTIENHKQSRYRSNVAKSRAAIAEYKAAQEQHESLPVVQRAHHVRVHHYERDDTELIPSVRPKQTESAPSVRHVAPTVTKEVVSEKPKALKVDIVTKKHKFSAEKEGQARFSGTLVIATADEEELLPEREPEVTPPQPTAPSARTAPRDTAPVVGDRPGRVAVANEDQAESAHIIIRSVTISSTYRRSLSFRLMLVSVWLLFMVLLSIGVLGSEVVWLVSEQSQVAMVQFDWSLVTNYINKYLNISSTR